METGQWNVFSVCVNYHVIHPWKYFATEQHLLIFTVISNPSCVRVCNFISARFVSNSTFLFVFLPRFSGLRSRRPKGKIQPQSVRADAAQVLQWVRLQKQPERSFSSTRRYSGLSELFDVLLNIWNNALCLHNASNGKLWALAPLYYFK